jgi:hypothetical protein
LRKGIVCSISNLTIRKFIFDKACGLAWIKHNIEEVGNFAPFLPKLDAAEMEAGINAAPAAPISVASDAKTHG